MVLMTFEAKKVNDDLNLPAIIYVTAVPMTIQLSISNPQSNEKASLPCIFKKADNF